MWTPGNLVDASYGEWHAGPANPGLSGSEARGTLVPFALYTIHGATTGYLAVRHGKGSTRTAGENRATATDLYVCI